MGKDFKQKIWSKRLNALIPEKNSEPIQSPMVVKSQKTVLLQQEKPKVVKSTTTVTTFRVNTEKLNQIKALAYWDRKKIQDVFDEALELYLKEVGEKNLDTAVEAFEKSQKR